MGGLQNLKAMGNSRDLAELSKQLGDSELGQVLAGNLEDADNCSPVIYVIGDSTGNETWEWVYLFAQMLAEKYPDHNVKYKLHSGINGSYDAWSYIQNVGEDRHLYVANTTGGTWMGSAYYNDADVVKTSPDLDISIKVALDDWQQTGNCCFVSKIGGTEHYCWKIVLEVSTIRLYWYTDGTNTTADMFNTTIDTSAFVDGDIKWFRITLDVDDGAGHYVATAYTSTDGKTWTLFKTSTGSTTTSILTDSTVKYSIGSTATNSNPLIGRYYEVIMRDGIDGAVINPQPIDACSIPLNSTLAFGGTPTICIYNASISGASVTDFNTAGAIDKAIPPSFGSYVFINLGHNEAAKVNAAYWAEMDTLLTSIRARVVYPNVFVLTQNPKLAKTTDKINGKMAHSIRCREAIAWAKKNGLEPINTQKAYFDSSVALDQLINPTDGQHDTEAGATLKANYVAEKIGL